jgi:hypothetical protein
MVNPSDKALYLLGLIPLQELVARDFYYNTRDISHVYAIAKELGVGELEVLKSWQRIQDYEWAIEKYRNDKQS